jgi:hypothetical protein
MVSSEDVGRRAAATAAIAAVRGRVGPDANVIWGGGVDESTGDPRPCRGTPLSASAFGARETPSCDGFGCSGIAICPD